MATVGAGFEVLSEPLTTASSSVDKVTVDSVGFDWLPDNFRNSVVEYIATNEGGFEATVRTSAGTKEDMAQWLCDFERRTKTKWLVRSTFPNVQRLSYRVDYVCQHSSFNKHDTKRASKNWKCCAKLTQKVNVLTKQTKKCNPHVKNGLPGVVVLRNVHNHLLKTAEVLRHLPPTAESRRKFEEYFANGMSVSEAMKYHTTELKLRSDVSEALLADGSVNPKYSTVHWWYDEWRRCNSGSGTDAAVLEENQETYSERGHRYPTPVSVQVSPLEVADDVTSDANSSNTIEEVIEKMCELNARFQSTPAAWERILKRLNLIKTAAQWEAFLLGADVSCCSTLRVQSTALCRRRPAVTRGSRRLAALRRYRLKR